MDAGGLGAHVERLADLGVGPAFGDEAQHVEFAGGQASDLPPRLAALVCGADARPTGDELDLLQQRPRAEPRSRGTGRPPSVTARAP